MSLRHTVLDLVYPRTCAGCGRASDGDDAHLCWDCLAGLEPVVAPFCSRCGDPVEGVIGHAYECSLCRRHPPGFTLARSAVRYRGAVCDVLQSFKYNGQAHLAVDLARLLQACVNVHFHAVRLDAVAYVPLYPARERARSYNQSRLLATRLARLLGVDLVPPRTVRRLRNTGTQTGLTAAQRRVNVEGAFRVPDPAWLEGRRVLLVDDVMTTGATVSACAEALQACKPAGVYVVTVARG